MDGFAIERWHDFFVAQAGAGAALAGLVFVAISINLQRLLTTRAVQGRAIEALALLVSLLIVGLAALIPQGKMAFATELILLGFAMSATMIAVGAGGGNAGGATRRQYALRLILGQCATLPLIAGGVSLLAGSGGGLYWLAVAAFAAIIAGMIGAWVLLVEILR
ncbi:MAG TPA: hypothetical protein VIJ42_16870 [Stellaceae bacterium]